MLYHLRETRRLLERIAIALESIAFQGRRAAVPKIIITREEDGMLTFSVQLGPKLAQDVVSRELSVTVNESTETRTLGPDESVAEGFSGEDNAAVHVELVDVDDAGNRSEPGVLDAVLTDTLPPPQPNVLGIQVTSES